MGVATKVTPPRKEGDEYCLEELEEDGDDEMAVHVSSVTVERLLCAEEEEGDGGEQHESYLMDLNTSCCHAQDEEDEEDEEEELAGDTEDTEDADSNEEDADGARSPTVFTLKRSESMRSSFTVRDTSIASEAACSCGRYSHRAQGVSPDSLDPSMRYGISVRVVGIESAEMNSRYIIRVDDAESGKQWEVRKSTKDMAAFYRDIRLICMEQAPVKKELWGTFRSLRKLRLPKKYIHSRGALCYQRRIVYDSLLRHTAALLTPAPMGPRRKRAVSVLQEFVGVPQFIDMSKREICSCWIFSNRLSARQLVVNTFTDPHHPINQECAAFVDTLTAKTHATRRTRLYPRQAHAILKTISRKLTEVKKAVLRDPELLAIVGEHREELNEDDFDDFVDDVRRAAAGFVQKAVVIPLEDHVHEALHVLYAEEEEKKLYPRMQMLQMQPPSFFGIPDRLKSWNEWEEARTELSRLPHYSVPLDKLRCIMRAAAAIFQSYNQGTPSCEPSLSTDEFMQIHFFVLVKCNLPRLLRTLHLLKLTCDQDDLTGEMGYYLTNFEAAIRLIEEHH